MPRPNASGTFCWPTGLRDLGLPVLYGLANDDGHRYHHIPSRGSEPGRGWIMVLSPELSTEALLAAIEAGRFYASSGVRLRQVTSGPDGLDVAVDAEPGVRYTIDFIGTRAGFDHKSEPVRNAAGKEIRVTRRYSNEIGTLFKSVEGEQARYQFGKNDLYVRAGSRRRRSIRTRRSSANSSAPGFSPFRGRRRQAMNRPGVAKR